MLIKIVGICALVLCVSTTAYACDPNAPMSVVCDQATVDSTLQPTFDLNFTDVRYHSSWGDVRLLASKGIVVKSEKFRPDDHASRAEALKMVILALNAAKPNWKGAPSASCHYGDVADDAWYAGLVNDAQSQGLILCQPMFRPDASISRQEFAKIAYLAMAKMGCISSNIASNKPLFLDDGNIDSTLKSYIYQLRAREILNGYGTGYFGPNDNITRSQIAKIVAKALFPDEAFIGLTNSDEPINFKMGVAELPMAQVGPELSNCIGTGPGTAGLMKIINPSCREMQQLSFHMSVGRKMLAVKQAIADEQIRRIAGEHDTIEEVNKYLDLALAVASPAASIYKSPKKFEAVVDAVISYSFDTPKFMLTFLSQNDNAKTAISLTSSMAKNIIMGAMYTSIYGSKMVTQRAMAYPAIASDVITIVNNLGWATALWFRRGDLMNSIAADIYLSQVYKNGFDILNLSMKYQQQVGSVGFSISSTGHPIIRNDEANRRLMAAIVSDGTLGEGTLTAGIWGDYNIEKALEIAEMVDVTVSGIVDSSL